LFCFAFWDGLTMSPRLPLNLQSSCISLLSAGITGVHHFVPFYLYFMLDSALLRGSDTGVWTWGLVLSRKVLEHLSNPTSPFCVGYFWDGVSLYAWACLDCNPRFCASHIARMTGACHCIQPWVEMGSHRLFVQAELEPWFSRSLASE
jgi:hypothetical protein